MFRKCLLTSLAFIALAFAACGQAIPYKAHYVWAAGAATAPGVIGTINKDQYLNFAADPDGLHTYHSIGFTVTGTAPSACTFRVEGSLDLQGWTGIDATAPAADPTPCTSTFMVHIPDKPVAGIRIVLVTYTPGDGTTKVVFSYGGK